MDEQEKNLKKYSECLTNHLRLRQRIVFKIKHSKTISSLGKFPKGRGVHSRRFTHQSKALKKVNSNQIKGVIYH